MIRVWSPHKSALPVCFIPSCLGGHSEEPVYGGRALLVCDSFAQFTVLRAVLQSQWEILKRVFKFYDAAYQWLGVDYCRSSEGFRHPSGVHGPFKRESHCDIVYPS